jgi:catechol 2,3-dioxygenase-like lactoylglutathione lyase family enzyme
MTRKALLVIVTVGVIAVALGTRWLAAEQAASKIGFKPELLIQLDVASLDRSIEFYTKKLGFKLTERRDDLKFAHLSTSIPGVQIGLGEVASPQPKGVVLNFEVTNTDAGRRVLEAAGIVFQGDTVTIPGKVKLAGFLDPDGHRLRLAGPAK